MAFVLPLTRADRPLRSSDQASSRGTTGVSSTLDLPCRTGTFASLASEDAGNRRNRGASVAARCGAISTSSGSYGVMPNSPEARWSIDRTSTGTLSSSSTRSRAVRRVLQVRV